MQWIIAFGLSIIVYMILQSIDDHRCRQKRIPCAATSRKVVLFFFVFIVVFVATFFFSGGEREGVATALRQKIVGGVGAVSDGFGDGSAPKVNELNMLKNIREDIYVGSGPFTRGDI